VGRQEMSHRDESAPGRRRLHAFFAGRVQGVGFRYVSRALGRRHGVAGWVRNLPDGRVELEVEGAEEVLRRYLRDLEHEFRFLISDREIRWLAPKGEYGEFQVRF